MSAAAARPMRTKVNFFKPGVTTVVTLEYSDGTEVDGKDGPQWRYFLVPNKIMYIDPDLHELIQTLEPQQRASVAITKNPNGSRKPWTVEAVQDEPLEAQLEQSIANAKNTTTARARAELAQPVAPVKPSRIHETTADEVREAAEAGHRITPRAAEIAAALMSAIDGAKAAEDYARSIGLKLQFSASDIRAMANTAQIGDTR